MESRWPSHGDDALAVLLTHPTTVSLQYAAFVGREALVPLLVEFCEYGVGSCVKILVGTVGLIGAEDA